MLQIRRGLRVEREDVSGQLPDLESPFVQMTVTVQLLRFSIRALA
jgi:hypothetical protein